MSMMKTWLSMLLAALAVLTAFPASGDDVPGQPVRIVAGGLDVATGSPADLEALVRRDIERYRRIIALTGARPEER